MKTAGRTTNTWLARALLVGSVVLAIACAPTGVPAAAAARLGINPASLVDVGSAALAPMVGGDGRVSVVVVHQRNGEWVADPITSSTGPANADSLHLITYGGATGDEWNTFVFGTAAPGTLRVELANFPDQRGGTVVDGAWIIALREKDLTPQDIEWRFIGVDGEARSGVGIFPADA